MRFIKPYSLVWVGAMVVLVQWAEARVLKVGQGGTYMYISTAVLYAQDGDTISVASGTPESPAVYVEQVVLESKSVLITAREVGVWGFYEG